MRQPVRWGVRTLLMAVATVLFCGTSAFAQLSITSMSPISGPVGSSVTLTGLNFGVTQGTSTVALNGTAAAVVNWSDTTVTVIVPSGASSGPFAVTVNDEIANSVAYTITALPSGWSDTDIGSVGVAGTASYANGIFTVEGAGNWSVVGSSSDAINFAYQTLSGDGTIVARVVSAQGGSIPEAGVLIRESLTAGSTQAAVGHNPEVYFFQRATTGSSDSDQCLPYPSSCSSVPLPYWVKVVRSGSTFTGFASPDGVNWTQIGSADTISMAQSVYIGLAVSSNSTSSLTTATFDNVSITSSSVTTPNISGVSATTGAAGTQVVLTGSGFGSSQNGSVVTLSGVPLPVNSWADTSISVTIPSGATTGPLLVSTAPQMNDSNYVTFTVTSQPLPSGWLDADIGVVSLAGSATYSNGTFTVKGVGSLGLSGTSDALHFVYQPLSGDGTITARLVSLQGSGTPQAAILIRESLNSGSTQAAVERSSNLYFVYRTTTGASSSYQCMPYPSYCSAVPVPFWVRLVRSGTTFTGYGSPDGVNWTQISSQTITMAQNVYIGLGVDSNGGSSLATATFDSVSISTPSAPGPIITELSATTGPVGSQMSIIGSGFGDSQNGSVATLNGMQLTVDEWTDTAIEVTIPSGATTGPVLVSIAPSMNDSNSFVFTVTSSPLSGGWLDEDVGAVGNAGSATYANGTFTVNGGGVWSLQEASDAMHFVYQPLSGDGTIIARIASRTTSSTITGVMIRETLQANSRSVSTEYNNYPYFVYRATTGTNSTYSYGSSVTLPYWVELVRSGNNFTSYASPDGVTWTQVGTTQTITMATNVYIGFAATSGSTTALATATFDNVSLSTPSNPAPVITSLSTTTGSAGTPVTITGSGFGTSQNDSIVVLNGTALPVSAWSNTSISVTIPSGATSGPLLVSVAPSMNDSNYVVFTVESQPLPTGWLDADIGAVHLAGTATFSGGTFTVNGAGDWYIQETSDAMHFVYQSLSGDGSIVARIASRSTNTTTAGVMIRPTLQSNSVSASAEYDNYPYFVYRTSTGSQSGVSNLGSVSLPYWVKLVRSTNTFTAYASPDGTTWTQIGSAQTITMPTTVYVGFAVASDSTTSLATATFDNVVVTSGVSIPTVTGISPSSGQANTTVTVYGASFGSSQGNSTLTFDGAAPASITSWTGSQIVATVPSTIQTGPVVVTVNSVQSNSSVIFTAFNPVITAIDPPSAPVGGLVQLSGYGFGGAQGTVSINGVQATGDPWSDTSITFSVPQNATSGPVTVTMNSGYTSNSVQLTIIESLSITGISPTTGQAGSVVTITGTGFGALQSDSVVTFDGVPATAVTSWSDTSIQAVVPNGAATGPVTVEVAGRTADGPTFQVEFIAQLTDSLGHQSTYTSVMVDGSWYVSQAQGPGCSTCTLRGNNAFQYDANGNIVSATDPLGYITSSAYDSNNNLTQLTQPAVSAGTPITKYTYNSFGEVLTMTDPLGNVTTNTYDSHGNLLTVTTPAPNGSTAASVTQFAYNSLGELTQITDPLGNITKIAYNSVGLISTITDPQNNVTSYGYDSRGNRTSVTDATNHTTTFTFDSGNRLTQITYPDTTTMSFGYDYRGRRTSVTDQNGKITSYAYDDADRLTSITDAANNVTTYSYDSEDNLLSIEDANHNTTSFTYDAYGRVTQTTFPSNLFETYQYDGDNDLTSKTDRKNQTIQYVYDALNRLTQKTYPDTTTADYTYDLVGKILSVNDPSGSYGFSYDNMGRLIGTTTTYSFLSGTNFKNAYTYDADSNRSGYTAPDNSTNTYTYDTVNRLSTLANSWAGSFGFSYDVLSRRTQMTRPNGVATNYTYDNLSHLLSVLHQLSGSTIDGATYSLDNAGNRTAKTDDLANVTTNYNYDPIYELLSATQGVTTESYSYDPVGNRLSSLGLSPYNVNTSNELTSTPSTSYAYDNNGNTTSKTNSTGTTGYTWDFENRVAQVTLPGQGGTVTFKYDPFGRRIYKSSSSATTIYAYDGDNVVETTDSSGGILSRFAQGQNIDEPLAESASGATDYYEADGLGSITSLTNGAGTVAQTYTYDSFGNVTHSTGSLVNPFQYTARDFDSETGLYYYRARYYDPIVGRFLGEDPDRFRAGANFYTYVVNNPVVLIDPLGFCWIYQQSTGNLYYNPYVFDTTFSPSLSSVQPTIYSSSSTYVGSGYSGFGPGLNNPIDQNVHNYGPPPQGYYTIGPMLPQGPGKTGRNVMQLTPDPGTITWGRTGFYIHGDNPCACHTASEGCIILPPSIRDKIADSPDKCMEVVQ